MERLSLSERIKEISGDLGIDTIKFVSPEPFENYSLKESPRRDPIITLPSAQTLIICGIYIGGFDVPDRDNPNIGQFSRLILSSFYFDVVAPLEAIVTLLKKEGYQAILCDGYNSSSVLPLKLAAVRAGIGWQGKNSLLITQEYGSFIALGGIITDAPLEREKVTLQKNHCGKCDACQKACPVNALEDSYKLNVDRCLSNSLEGDELSEDTRLAMGNKILECDACQLACPWNQKHLKSPVKSNYKWAINDRFGNIDDFFKLSNLAKLSEEEFNQYLGYTLVGVDFKTFRRNLMAATLNR